jgi:hypothetical protein
MTQALRAPPLGASSMLRARSPDRHDRREIVLSRR